MSTTTLKPSQLRALLAKTIPAKHPLLITGAPGVGKSDIVTQAAVDAGADLIISHPVVSDPTDYKGMPWVSEGHATFLPFGELQHLIDAKKLTLHFMDDLGQAPPSVQASAMQLILARQINGHKVSPHVVFMAATNRRGDRANVQEGILEPVKSRFTSIVELRTEPDDWCGWAINSNIRPEVIAFIRFRPALLCDFKPTADMSNSPCPRTWHSVSKIVDLGLPADLQLATIEGAIGQGAAVEFVSFMRVYQSMVSPDLVLTAPDNAPIPEEPSALYALATALAIRVQKDSMGRYCRYLERLVGKQLGAFSAVSMQTALQRDQKLANTAAYVKAMSGPLGQLLVGGSVS